MGKTCHFHVTALNKAPCSHSRQFESFRPAAGGCASCRYKITRLNCPPSPSWRAGGSCQAIAITMPSGSLPIWEASSANHHVLASTFCPKCFCRRPVHAVHRKKPTVWPSTRISGHAGKSPMCTAQSRAKHLLSGPG